MASASEMVSLLETALASNAGVKSITVDGVLVQFNDRLAMIRELEHWQRIAARQSGKRPICMGINLGNF